MARALISRAAGGLQDRYQSASLGVLAQHFLADELTGLSVHRHQEYLGISYNAVSTDDEAVAEEIRHIAGTLTALLEHTDYPVERVRATTKPPKGLGHPEALRWQLDAADVRAYHAGRLTIVELLATVDESLRLLSHREQDHKEVT